MERMKNDRHVSVTWFHNFEEENKRENCTKGDGQDNWNFSNKKVDLNRKEANFNKKEENKKENYTIMHDLTLPQW